MVKYFVSHSEKDNNINANCNRAFNDCGNCLKEIQSRSNEFLKN